MISSVIKGHLRSIFSFVLYLVANTVLMAQTHSESVYSDQAFEERGEEWYQSPFVWVGLVLILGVVFLMLKRQGRRTS